MNGFESMCATFSSLHTNRLEDVQVIDIASAAFIGFYRLVPVINCDFLKTNSIDLISELIDFH